MGTRVEISRAKTEQIAGHLNKVLDGMGLGDVEDAAAAAMLYAIIGTVKYKLSREFLMEKLDDAICMVEERKAIVDRIRGQKNEA